MDLERYTIRNQAEETECDSCGYPLYVGDIAVFDYDTSLVYCSVPCAKADQVILQDNKPYWDLA